MDKYERAALRFANKIRKINGQKALEKLPKGFMGSVNSCPIANALSNGVKFKVNGATAEFSFRPEIPKNIKQLAKLGNEEFEANEEFLVEIPLPDDVQDFITEFDVGEYSHLIKH